MVRGPIPRAIVNSATKTPTIPNDWAAIDLANGWRIDASGLAKPLLAVESCRHDPTVTLLKSGVDNTGVCDPLTSPWLSLPRNRRIASVVMSGRCDCG